MKQQVPDILFVINDFTFLKSHRLGHIKFLSEKGLNILICTDCSGTSKAEIELLNKVGIKILNLRLSRSSIGIFKNLYSLIQLLKIILRYRPKRLSLVSAKPIVLGGLLSLFHRFDRVYFSITGLGYVFIDQSLRAKFIRVLVLTIYKIIFSKRNSLVVFQNGNDLNLFLRRKVVTLNKTIVIPGNGIDTDLFNKSESMGDKVRFLFASRLLIDKGVKEFVNAVKGIGSSKASFTIVGELDKQNPNCISKEYFGIIKEDPDISYIERIEHCKMPDLFSNSDVFVLPSYGEGLPQVALEAASCKMPLILTDVKGCRECINQSKNGFLVMKGDSKDLEDKMRLFINNSDLIKKMGEESRKYIIDKFSKEKIYNSFYELYSG